MAVEGDPGFPGFLIEPANLVRFEGWDLLSGPRESWRDRWRSRREGCGHR